MTYATAEEVTAYLDAAEMDLVLPDDEDDAAALIGRAERDVDSLLSAELIADPVTGRKLSPGLLTAAQVAALTEATCAAVEFRLTIEEGEMVGDDSVESVGPLRLGPTPRPPSPKVREALQGMGFPWRSGTVAPALDATQIEAT